ncbi:MAG: peptidylprolyl isomerase [Thermodesulfobacteriota bacterium]
MKVKLITLCFTFIALLALTTPGQSAETAATAPTGKKNIIMETSKGTMEIELFDAKAPLSCQNFRQYVKDGFFNGLIFHRVIPGFMIQGGGFEPGMKKRAGRGPIMNEAHNGLKNKRGTLAMARTNEVNSATAQFFINVKDNTSLDHRSMKRREYGYAVFGRVVKGMEVADAIVATPRGHSGMYNDVPVEDVVILKVFPKQEK